MLHIIEGPAGSGKTTKAYELLLKGASEHKDRNFILVIPEQSSISAQKDIIDMSPNHGILNIDILSFNRLAHRIFEVAGGEAADLIDDSGKNLIIRHIAGDMNEDLQVLGGELRKSGYVAEIRSVISEFMQYGISPEDIPAIAEEAGKRSPYLSRKLNDVAFIYKRFKEYMGNDFMTREELLIKASAESHNAPFLKSSTLIFDSFTGFTPVQYTFIEALLTQCEDIYVCMTRTEEKRGELFALGDTTKEKLEAIAEHHGGLDEIWLRSDMRHEITSDIKKLGEKIFVVTEKHYTDKNDNEAGSYPDDGGKPEVKTDNRGINGEKAGRSNIYETGTVMFYLADEPYAEAREALQRIAYLVREEGYHYKDCGILMGDTAGYADIVRSEAEVMGVPVYVDQTRHISLNPFTELIRALLLVVKENYSYPSVFHLLRSGLTDIITDDIDMAENYIIATGIRGRTAYSKSFEVLFHGVSEESRQAAERVRIRLAEILAPLAGKVSDKGAASVNDLITSVRDICVRLSAEDKLKEYVSYFEEKGDAERAMEYSQIYDILNRQFDNMAALIGDQEVSIQEFSELYEDALSEIRVGVIPPKSDVVMAGDLTRSRFNHIRALFFIGMTEGVIPASGNKGGLISDGDRQILQALGIEVAPTAAENAEKEKFYFYMNLMKPSELVSFSYPKGTLDGGVNRESYFMKEARRCLGVEEPSEISGKRRAYSGDALMAAFAESVENESGAAALYLRAIEEAEEGKDHIERLTHSLIKSDETEERLTKEAGDILFGGSFIESPTELERFASCPYGHFLDYGLRLRERRGFEFEMRDIGTLLHKVLELFSRRLVEERLSFRSVTDDKAKILLESAIRDAASDATSGRIASLVTSSARYAYSLERLRSYAYRSIDTLRYQSKQGSFDNIYFERKFDFAGFRGTIDRSDEAVTDSGIFIDIIDYKTGNKTFEPERIYHGLDIQLPLYMSAALDMRGTSVKGRIVRPAGLFYYHVDDPIVEGTRNSGADEITDAIHKELRLRGVVNADMEAVRAFDKNLSDGGKSVVIPVGFKKDGAPEASARLYTEEQLKGMMGHTLRLSDELRQRIAGGDVSRSPYQLDGRTGCDYCAYKAICDGGRKKKLEKHDFPDIWSDADAI
ncbi:MAG: PD-(D/E)XK nuclease family protein [Lachnospiraceae bacterium]|nr:PD-(D/E)XK nuclease family protein [Lachnospiraceae bacterium]